METQKITDKNASELTLLIYIPCYSDYELALDNIRRIRAEKNAISYQPDQTPLQIKIAISINGVDLSTKVINEIKIEVDQIFYFQESIGADSNITHGFMTALQERPDFFWILSANEILKPNAISYLSDRILTNTDADIIITNSRAREGTFEIGNVFIDLPPGLGLGFISGVVYNFSKMEFAFPAAPKFSWTGWGQLAVLQVACSKLKFLKVFEFPDSNLYENPKTYIDIEYDELNSLTEFETVRKNYQHSFFGMPILIASLYSRDPKMRKLITSDWIKHNWFKIKYFSSGVDSGNRILEPHFDTHWIRRISKPLFFQGANSSRILSFVGWILNLEKIRGIKLFQKIFARFEK